MFLRMVRKAFARGWRKKLLAVTTVALGTSLAVAMLNVALDIGDKVNRELKSYGANILVTPAASALPVIVNSIDLAPLADQSYLPQKELVQLKMLFWKNNILGFAPYLQAKAETPQGTPVALVGTWFQKPLVIPTGETVTAGVRDIKPWWQVEGAWPEDKASGSALVGQAIAQKLSLKPGDTLDLFFPGQERGSPLKVTGTVSAGGEEDKQVFVPLAWLQEMARLQGKVSQVEVSALTTPRNALARKAEKDPDSLTREEFDTWYCTPYVDSITYQIEEAIPGARARPIRQIAESEGAILSKIRMLMAFLALAAVVSSALGISSLMSAAVLERSKEIGLLKALGAHNSSITWSFLAEAFLIGVLGGVLGGALGLSMARFISQSVFGASLSIKALAVVAAFAISVGIALLGSLSTARIISRLQPVKTLGGK